MTSKSEAFEHLKSLCKTTVPAINRWKAALDSARRYPGSGGATAYLQRTARERDQQVEWLRQALAMIDQATDPKENTDASDETE